MTIRNDPTDDAEFVIFGSRLADGSVGYANHNGDFVAFARAETYGYQDALGAARDIARSVRAAVYVAPLLFGVPDGESLIYVTPPSA